MLKRQKLALHILQIRVVTILGMQQILETLSGILATSYSLNLISKMISSIDHVLWNIRTTKVF